jgi:hypothetical protein
MKGAPSPRPEQELQKTVAAWLVVMVPKPPLGPLVSAIAPAPGNSTKLRTLRRLMGLKPGMPNLMLVWKGRALFVTLCPPGVEPDMQQRLRALEIAQCGGAATVCRSLQDFVDFVRRTGIPTVEADAYRKVVA